MKKKLQVFISSTYNDMLPERQAAVEAVLQAGHIPAGMELFSAADESQWDTIQTWIQDSDVFLLILGGRYGSIEPKSGKSYIQREYEYACSARKPHFAVIISETLLESKVANDGTGSIELENRRLLKEFREIVTTKICSFYSDLKELKLNVFVSLNQLENNKTLVGWVKGSEAVDPTATLAEMSRLQEENRQLHVELAHLRAYAESLIAQGTAIRLSDDASKLLISAVSGDGSVLYLKLLEGAQMQAGSANLIVPPNSHREEARWKAALDELIDRGCVEEQGIKGESFMVTKLGYEIADKLTEQR